MSAEIIDIRNAQYMKCLQEGLAFVNDWRNPEHYRRWSSTQLVRWMLICAGQHSKFRPMPPEMAAGMGAEMLKMVVAEMERRIADGTWAPPLFEES